MSDPRAGNFAVMFGFCVFLIKFTSLAVLPLQQLGTILILTPAWARLSESFAIGRFPYLKESGKGKIWHDTMRFPHDLFVAAIAPMVVLIGCARSGIGPACAISLATVAAGVAAAFWINNKLGGHTGDTYGAVVELAETGGLLTLALAFNCLV